MGGARGHAVALASGPLFGLAPLLMRRMRRDLDQNGSLRRSTAWLMWSAYNVHGTSFTAALLNEPARMPKTAQRQDRWGQRCPRRGRPHLGLRQALANASQLTGTSNGDLITDGPYRYSRNPQYIGLLATVIGLGTAR